MRVLKLLLGLHEGTKLPRQRSGRRGVAFRMFVRPYEINRIGRNYDEINRNDVCTEMVLKSYLARKVYYNEKRIRDKYKLHTEEWDAEDKFTYGLWTIFCAEVFGESFPELPVPTTYDELQVLFDNKELHEMNFNLYKTVKEAITHNQLNDSGYCTSFMDFDLFCSLPGEVGWTSPQENARRVDGRLEAPQRLFQVSAGMFKYEYINCPEPYKNFWKERAYGALKKAIVYFKSSYILRFRNATMYEMYPVPIRFEPVESFTWNLNRT